MIVNGRRYVNVYDVNRDSGPFCGGWILVWNPLRKDSLAIQAITSARSFDVVASFGPAAIPDICRGIARRDITLIGASPHVLEDWSASVRAAADYDTGLRAI